MNVDDPIGKGVGSGGPEDPHESSQNECLDLVGGGHLKDSVGKNSSVSFKGNQFRGNLRRPRPVLGPALDIGDEDRRVGNVRLEKSLQV